MAKSANDRTASGRWLLKTEPATYPFERLVKEGRTTWDGVKNPIALKHLAGIKGGDAILIYHTGDERAVVGRARARGTAYPDPKAGDPKLLVVDIEPVAPLPRPVSLAAIKADPRFADFALVRMGRLSVMPVSGAQWDAILTLAG